MPGSRVRICISICLCCILITYCMCLRERKKSKKGGSMEFLFIFILCLCSSRMTRSKGGSKGIVFTWVHLTRPSTGQCLTHFWSALKEGLEVKHIILSVFLGKNQNYGNVTVVKHLTNCISASDIKSWEFWKIGRLAFFFLWYFASYFWTAPLCDKKTRWVKHKLTIVYYFLPLSASLVWWRKKVCWYFGLNLDSSVCPKHGQACW